MEGVRGFDGEVGFQTVWSLRDVVGVGMGPVRRFLGSASELLFCFTEVPIRFWD